MFPRPSDRALVFAVLAGTTVLAVGACGGGGSGQTSSPSAGEPTATVTTTSTATSTATATETATATATASSTTGTGGGATPTCTTGALKIGYSDDKGGGAAGSVMGTFTFTNTGSAACSLRGFPGVSYVTGAKGTQVGAAATRTGDTATTKTLAQGQSAKVALRRVQPGNYGSSCQQTKVDGFRVFPPASTTATFVAFTTTGCKSTNAPLLQVGPVR